jgi:hypothetical protein
LCYHINMSRTCHVFALPHTRLRIKIFCTTCPIHLRNWLGKKTPKTLPYTYVHDVMSCKKKRKILAHQEKSYVYMFCRIYLSLLCVFLYFPLHPWLEINKISANLCTLLYRLKIWNRSQPFDFGTSRLRMTNVELRTQCAFYVPARYDVVYVAVCWRDTTDTNECVLYNSVTTSTTLNFCPLV